MQFLIYLFIYPFLWVISMLPFRLLYILSDLIYLIIYKLIRYRKKIVSTNIAMAFPHLSEKERLEIEKKSYHHLCDMFLEMIKTMNISDKEIEQRFRCTNIEIYEELEKKGKSIVMFCSHYASYEWAISINRITSFEGFGIYKKIANPYFDKLVKNIRLRFKANLITTKETKSVIEKNAAENRLCLYGFASDQSPRLSDRNHWYSFMGIETPIHIGGETLAKDYDMNIIFLNVKKVKRGFYEATLETMTDGNTREIPDYKISELFIKKVEQQILEAPEFYLWTHKRWKHRRN